MGRTPVAETPVADPEHAEETFHQAWKHLDILPKEHAEVTGRSAIPL